MTSDDQTYLLAPEFQEPYRIMVDAKRAAEEATNHFEHANDALLALIRKRRDDYLSAHIDPELERIVGTIKEIQEEQNTTSGESGKKRNIQINHFFGIIELAELSKKKISIYKRLVIDTHHDMQTHTYAIGFDCIIEIDPSNLPSVLAGKAEIVRIMKVDAGQEPEKIGTVLSDDHQGMYVALKKLEQHITSIALRDTPGVVDLCTLLPAKHPKRTSRTQPEVM